MLTELPKSKDIMENPMGFPTSFELPIIKDLTNSCYGHSICRV